MQPIMNKTILLASLLWHAMFAASAQAEICVMNGSPRKVRIIQAEQFGGGHGKPMTFSSTVWAPNDPKNPAAGGSYVTNPGYVDKRVLMPQEEYCIPAQLPAYDKSTRFAFQLIADLTDVKRRVEGAEFYVTPNPLPTSARLLITGAVPHPNADRAGQPQTLQIRAIDQDRLERLRNPRPGVAPSMPLLLTSVA